MCLEDSSGFITQIGDGGQFVVNYLKKNSSLACASFSMQNLDLMRTKFSGILGMRLNIFFKFSKSSCVDLKGCYVPSRFG